MKFPVLLIAACCFPLLIFSQTSKVTGPDSVMITIFLKHQQDKSLGQLQQIQEQNHFWEQFPPKETRVVSWYVMMGIGQVVTLKVAPNDVRKLNLSIENGAWGAFKTEFYPTYDYVPVWKEMMKKKKE